jgi:hypothetical protein
MIIKASRLCTKNFSWDVTLSSRQSILFSGIYQAGGCEITEDSDLVRLKINIPNLSIWTK